jgi:hypothetical protein
MKKPGGMIMRQFRLAVQFLSQSNVTYNQESFWILFDSRNVQLFVYRNRRENSRLESGSGNGLPGEKLNGDTSFRIGHGLIALAKLTTN